MTICVDEIKILGMKGTKLKISIPFEISFSEEKKKKKVFLFERERDGELRSRVVCWLAN